MEDLDEKLNAYAESGAYSFCMPGHKGKGGAPYAIDITEIDGFDDLHNPSGVLADLQNEAADLYGVEHVFLLINGSTSGNLAAIYAAVPQGGQMLIARNCHKSIYHAAILREARVSYLFPKEYVAKDPVAGALSTAADGEQEDGAGIILGIAGEVEPVDVAAALCNGDAINLCDAATAQDPNMANAQSKTTAEQGNFISTVVITSPTYEGVSSNIKEIAEICHENGASLIVDAAHGAHFPFLYGNNLIDGNPAMESGVKPKKTTNGGQAKARLRGIRWRDYLSADAIVVSLHKTLPALTQTALLLLPEGSRIPKDRIADALHIFQTSSPSYVLMASVAKCLRLMRNEREHPSLLKKYTDALEMFFDACSNLTRFRVLGDGQEKAETRDMCKLLIYDAKSEYSGKEIMDILRWDYQIELEMASFRYALAISTVADTDEDLSRLYHALKDMEEKARQTAENPMPKSAFGQPSVKAVNKTVNIAPETVLPLAKAFNAPREYVPLERAKKRIAANFVSIYPPGTPVLVPGERVTEDAIAHLTNAQKAGLTVTGIADDELAVIDAGFL